MADWELFAGSVSAVVALISWARWYADIVRVNRLAAKSSYRFVLGLSPVTCLLLLLLALDRSAARAVRENGLYILIYITLGSATLGVSAQLYPLLGLSARDDVLERRNGAALAGIIGALLGSAFCVMGGNIGEGPGVEAVIASIGAALCVWFVLWYLLEVLSGRVVSERITVERDIACGLRLASLLAANGLLLGAAAAGDWIAERFLRDFLADAWPAAALTVTAALIERLFASPLVGRSVLTASGYLVIAVIWVVHRGLGK